MRKIIVGILSSQDETYDAFKKVWLRNIEHWTQRKKNKHEIRAYDFEFYFIYGGENEGIIQHEQYTDLYYAYPETLPNMLRKTLRFFEHINEKYVADDILVLRTNLSTLFDFDSYTTWLRDVPRNLFFGGSIIDGFEGESTKFSGTNMIMSKDVMQFIIQYQDRFTYNYNEDIELSSMVMFNLNKGPKQLRLKAMKRVDFIQDAVMYHKCDMYAEDVACFRFKTQDRKSDVTRMHNILACLQTGVSVTKFIQTQLRHLPHRCEAGGMSILSEQVWYLTQESNAAV